VPAHGLYSFLTQRWKCKWVFVVQCQWKCAETSVLLHRLIHRVVLVRCRAATWYTRARKGTLKAPSLEPRMAPTVPTRHVGTIFSDNEGEGGSHVVRCDAIEESTSQHTLVEVPIPTQVSRGWGTTGSTVKTAKGTAWRADGAGFRMRCTCQ
jgi:hypothetical protein